MENGKVILSVLLGAGVGVLAGVLFAPRKGSETLRLIEDSVDNKLDEFFNKTSQTTKKAKVHMEDAENQTREALNF